MFILTEQSKIVNMDDERLFYVYLLINPTTQNPFYVGKGKGRRNRFIDHFTEAFTNTGSNKHKLHTIQKIVNAGMDVIVDVVFSSFNEQECFDEERRLISLFGRRDLNTGYLTNLTDGGEGVSNYIYTKEQKTKRSIRARKENNPMWGRQRTQEEKKKISKTRTERLNSGAITPHKHTEEHKRQLREFNPGGVATSRQIFQIDDAGRVVKLWSSMRSAGICLGIKSWRNISKAAKTGTKKVGGFYWRWVDELETIATPKV